MGQSNSAIIDGKGAQYSVTLERGDGAQQVKISLENINGKTVGVTGANGFIGSHIVKQLLAKGYKVRGTVQDLAHDAVDFLKILPRAVDNLTLYKAELSEDGSYDEAFQGCDCVFHLASPTLQHQNDYKHPETEMLAHAVSGTLNVLQSCKKNDVKSVVITSSLCAAVPKPDTPEVLNEAHWANVQYLMDKGSYYAASKTKAERAAIEFVAGMPRESAFRLVRICPSFTVGPTLHPVINSSMSRFAAICRGIHHGQIPNRSISLIDVRDTAAHHIAAYEKGHEGRFFSLTEAWPWTLVYDALNFYCPEMKLPEPLPEGTKHKPARKYNTTRMRQLGVNERSFMECVREAATECQTKKIFNDIPISCKAIPLEAYLGIGGYYDIGQGTGTFFMVRVICSFSKGQYVVNEVVLSWLLQPGGTPTYVDVNPSTMGNILKNQVLEFKRNNEEISLTFARQKEGLPGIWTVAGAIGDTRVNGISYLGCVPFAALHGTYTIKDGDATIKVHIEKANNFIIDPHGNKRYEFFYDPLQRQFSIQGEYKLYFYSAAGNGLRVELFSGSGRGLVYSQFPKFTVSKPVGNPSGASELASFAGYYPLTPVGGALKPRLGFVSIVPRASGPLVSAEISGLAVGVSTNNRNSLLLSDFVFQENRLTFDSGSVFTFDKTPKQKYSACAKVTVATTILIEGAPQTLPLSSGMSFFATVPLSAFIPDVRGASITFHGTVENGSDLIRYSLQISKSGDDVFSFSINEGSRPVLNPTTRYVYSAIDQLVTIFNKDDVSQYLYFCYDIPGISCRIVTPSNSLVVVVFLQGFELK